ncbi:gamma-glutamylcyclotransferase [Kiritimatiellota bacterium B12222]|nr:gamma-glutamylcyclotransferase [Kiritimatiellota bacterium B12222]
MNQTLFAYGTLQHPDIISFVLDRVPPHQPALLHDFARYAIKGQDFPGLISQPGAQTEGTAFYEISLTEWEMLDRYESDLYERQTVAMLPQNGPPESAEVYILPPHNHHVLSTTLWELKNYRPNPQP